MSYQCNGWQSTKFFLFSSSLLPKWIVLAARSGWVNFCQMESALNHAVNQSASFDPFELVPARLFPQKRHLGWDFDPVVQRSPSRWGAYSSWSTESWERCSFINFKFQRAVHTFHSWAQGKIHVSIGYDVQKRLQRCINMIQNYRVDT